MDEINELVNKGVKPARPYLDLMIMTRIKISQMKNKTDDEKAIKILEGVYDHYERLLLEKLESYDPFNTP